MYSRKFALQWLQVEQLNKELISLNESLDEKIRIRTKQLEASNEKLRELALLDSLTGIFNRHYLSSSLEKLYKHYTETNIPFAVLILDVDEFKKYNDYYGHILGDQLLKNLVKILTDVLPNRAEFLKIADQQLYEAKNAGRNCVRVKKLH